MTATVGNAFFMAPPGEKPSKATDVKHNPALWETAQKFETVFVAQMLKQAKIGEHAGAFSGGYAADTYRSFLVDEYAKAATQSQSFGLAEALYKQMSEKVSA
jgi:flagellar protein FlgJ